MKDYNAEPKPIERSPSPDPVSDEEEEEEEDAPEPQKSEDIKSLLMAKLNEGKKQPKPFHFDIEETITVDSWVLNFGNFFPEKLLGSILTVQNQTDDEQIVELTIDSKTQIYDTE